MKMSTSTTFSSEVQKLLRAKNAGLNLHQLIILQVIRSQPRYIAQLADILESNHATVRRMVLRLINAGWVEQIEETAATGYQSRPYSALIQLTDEGTSRLDNM